MALFHVTLFEIGGVHTPLMHITPSGHAPADSASRSKLNIPWSDLQETPDTYSLLTWHTHKDSFAGRSNELKELHRWAKSSQQVSARFLTAPGGTGKSRLAAEFATQLQQQGWSAGFVDLRKAAAYESNGAGTLLIIDYPEENREAVKELLGDMAHAGLGQRVRVLFLTRSSVADWRAVIETERACPVVNWNPVPVGSLTPEEAFEIYSKALERAAEAEGTTPPPLSVEAVGEWMQMVPQNALPLFLVATAVFSAQNPEEMVVSYSGPQVMEALNKRETIRLQRAAIDGGLPQNALALALTYATLCKGVPLEAFREQPKLCKLLGLKKGKPWADLLAQSGHLLNGTLRNLEPDIVGADFVHATLGCNRDKAPELVWRAAARSPEEAIGTFGRLIYDAQDTLGRPKSHLQDWLLEALEDDARRCGSLKPWTQSARLPHTLGVCSVFISRHALKEEMDDATRAQWLNNLSLQLSALGQEHEAIEANKEGVCIYRRLAEQDPLTYELNLAKGLNNLSNRLTTLGQQREALEAIKETRDIYRRLAEQKSAAFEEGLGTSLNNLSAILLRLDKHEEALEASKEAITIYQRLVENEPATIEPYLARSLNNLSVALFGLGQHDEALKATRDAVGIRRRLCAQEPAAFEPELVRGLVNLSNRLTTLHRQGEALEAVMDAVSISRRLAAQNLARFEPDLAMSLGAMTQTLNANGQHEKALEAIEEGSAIFCKHAEHNFLGVGSYLVMTLRDKARTLIALARPDEAAAALAEADEIERRLEEAQKAGVPQG